MSPDFTSRMIGLIVFMLVGIQFGGNTADTIGINREFSAFIFGLLGILFGVIMTPWLTVRPVRMLRRSLNAWSVERLVMSLIGATIGLGLALLASYPLSTLPGLTGQLAPTIMSVVCLYLGISVFGLRAREIFDTLSMRTNRSNPRIANTANRHLILDTSVLIDGRIVEVAETGFLGGLLVVPRFVLSELHHVADSSDALRRERGRRGLNKLNELQRSEVATVQIVDDDFEDIQAVDDKLVALALQMSGSIMTNDYNLNRVADAQGVQVLNINELSNAVRSVYIPGERFAIRVFQEGRDEDQGVGYLKDGTMVVIESGQKYMDRTIEVEVTKLINRPAGRMIFAIPTSEIRPS